MNQHPWGELGFTPSPTPPDAPILRPPPGELLCPQSKGFHVGHNSCHGARGGLCMRPPAGGGRLIPPLPPSRPPTPRE